MRGIKGGIASLIFFLPGLRVLKTPKYIRDRNKRAKKLVERNNRGMILTAEENIELEEFVEEGTIKIFHEVASGGDMERFQASISESALQ